MRVRSLGQEDSPGGGHGNPLQYACLENSKDRGAWRAAVPGVPNSQTPWKQLGKHTRIEHSVQLLAMTRAISGES